MVAHAPLVESCMKFPMGRSDIWTLQGDLKVKLQIIQNHVATMGIFVQYLRLGAETSIFSAFGWLNFPSQRPIFCPMEGAKYPCKGRIYLNTGSLCGRIKFSTLVWNFLFCRGNLLYSRLNRANIASIGANLCLN